MYLHYLLTAPFTCTLVVLCIVDLLYHIYWSRLQNLRESRERNINMLCSSHGHYITYVSAVVGLRILQQICGTYCNVATVIQHELLHGRLWYA
jgi:hypothetical protein